MKQVFVFTVTFTLDAAGNIEQTIVPGHLSAPDAASAISTPNVRKRRIATAKSDKPKLTRAEVLEKARAARAAKHAGKTLVTTAQKVRAARTEVLEIARKAHVARKATDKPAAAPKLTRAEVLAKARAARAAKRQAAVAPPAKPKLTRSEIMAKARAARGVAKAK